MVVVGPGGVGTNVDEADIESKHDRWSPVTMHSRSKQAQRKMCHSPKNEDVFKKKNTS